jgi:hypothetical protein
MGFGTCKGYTPQAEACATYFSLDFMLPGTTR